MLSGDMAIDLWEQVRDKLKQEAGDTVFENWLGLISLASFSNGNIVLAVHSKFHKDWIEPRYGNRIRSYSISVSWFNPIFMKFTMDS